MLAAFVAVTGAEAAQKCARPWEVTAIQAAAIQQELMVAALTCHDVSDFNAFQTSYNRELRSSDITLRRMFHRLFGSSHGEAEYHAFKTRLANDSSMRSIHNNPDYCREASLVFSAALAPAKQSLAEFVAGVPVKNEESPVDSCEISVAGGLNGTAIPTIVPRPNPVRIAQNEQAPADAPPTPIAPPASAPTPDTSNSAPQDQTATAPEPGVLPAEGEPAAPPAKKATDTAAVKPQPAKKKDSGGWLSGLGDMF